MGSIDRFFGSMDWARVLSILLSAGAALFCITVHELCHGLAAYALGDSTAKDAGRLTLNPLRHIDLFGLLMMVTARVGWAKPVPVDMRNFRHPRRGMALVALAGPGSNFVLALLALLIARPVLWYAPPGAVTTGVLTFLCHVALLSVGLGVFNLIPVPPLDGSKIIFSFFPERVYFIVLRYERYMMLAVLALVWMGVLDRPLTFLIGTVLEWMCQLTGVPVWVVVQLIF